MMKKYNKAIIIYIIFLPYFLPVNSQVTIGSTLPPDNNALLDLKENTEGESSKGLLLPRVTLISLLDPFPLTRHTEGIIVYNIQDIDDYISKGLYKNDGTKWVRMQLPDGKIAGQFLVFDKSSEAPKWTTITIDEQHDYIMAARSIYDTIGVSISDNVGPETYIENSDITSDWKNQVSPIKIETKVPDNKLIIYVQTSMLQSRYEGWTSYAGGLFINDKLKGVRVGMITTAGGSASDPVSKLETLFFVIENLPVGENFLKICYKRRNSDGTLSPQPILNIGKNLMIDGIIHEGHTNLSCEYFEKYLP
ncbi:MAG: hypothetical protein LBT43_13015 [Prevotella sp.]|jgi:hypothetical protein|nr:hypothetical protein [Prevotella sp.]